jgi:uncharacterized protein YbjT (DUF2867 family)
MAADDVASALAQVAVGPPVNGIVEVAGPDQFRLDELIRSVLKGRNDPREVITDPRARYYGITPSERTLLPGDDAASRQHAVQQRADQGPARRIAPGQGEPPCMRFV